MNSHLDKELQRWLRAWQQLHVMHTPKITAADIDAFVASLPPRKADESLVDWLARPKRQVLADFMRLAASSGDELALPEHPWETSQFRLSVLAKGDVLEITLQALGMASDEYAHSQLELADSEGRVFASMALDYRGNGQASIADTDAHRRALLRPQLYRAE